VSVLYYTVLTKPLTLTAHPWSANNPYTEDLAWPEIDDCVGSFDRVDLVAVKRPRLRREQPSSSRREEEVARGLLERRCRKSTPITPPESSTQPT